MQRKRQISVDAVNARGGGGGWGSRERAKSKLQESAVYFSSSRKCAAQRPTATMTRHQFTEDHLPTVTVERPTTFVDGSMDKDVALSFCRSTAGIHLAALPFRTIKIIH